MACGSLSQLVDALSLLLSALDQQPWRFDIASPRWHARLCAEARLTLAEAQLAVASARCDEWPQRRCRRAGAGRNLRGAWAR
jgi:hypothetical protein